MAFAVYSLRVRVIFIATVRGESNTSNEQMWKVLCLAARGTSVLCLARLLENVEE